MRALNLSRLCYNNNMVKRKRGFTLIEATFGIAFLAILMITIAVLTNSVLKSYQKGATIKSVNTVGRSIIEDMTTSVTSAPSKDLIDTCRIIYPTGTEYDKCINDSAYLFTFSQRHSNSIKVEVAGKSEPQPLGSSVPVSGTFCTGKYSYIWNTGYAMSGGSYSGGSPSDVKYYIVGKTEVQSYNNNHDGKPFRLLKILDPLRIACASRVQLGGVSGIKEYALISESNNTYDLTLDTLGSDYILTEEPVDLLMEQDKSIVLYDLSVYPPAQDDISQHIFVSASFILGTMQGGIDITSGGDYCQTPNTGTDLGFNYCALNKFNFAMQSTGE